MSGTVVVSEIASGNVKQISFTWTSDASGNATASTTGSYSGTPTMAVFTPGTSTPTNLYDVTLKDVANVDILGGAGANLTVVAAVAKQAADGLTAITSTGVLALSITNAGNVKTGVIVVYITGVSNAYCTLAQVKGQMSSQGLNVDATDDNEINEMIDQASRAIDVFCGGRTFYARTAETRYFDAIGSLQIDFDDDCLGVTTLTNGDASTISATYYDLLDKNTKPYFAIRLKDTSGYVWLPDSTGSNFYAVSVLGTWGYVDRTGTDWRSVQVIRNTEDACIDTVVDAYKNRYGANTTTATIVTPAGMTITPADIPPRARAYIAAYTRRY